MRKLKFTSEHLGWFLVLTVFGVVFTPAFIAADKQKLLGSIFAWLPLFVLVTLLICGIALIGHPRDKK